MSLEQWLHYAARPYSTMLFEKIVDHIQLTSRRLNFDMELQTQSNWCWAATATSVSEFYWLGSTWTQCLVASGELGRNDCCNSPVPNECNVPWFLDRALDRTNNFVSWTSGTASFQTIRNQIDAGRPVGVRIGWNGGGGHFMVIYGYAELAGQQFLDIDDPIFGKVQLSVNDFTTNYQSSGSWTHTYYTQGFIPMIPIVKIHINDHILQEIWRKRILLNRGHAGTREPGDQDKAWENASLTLAHPVHVVGLDFILEGDPDTAGDIPPTTLRVLETEDKEVRAVFDLSADEEAQLQQMTASPVYVSRLTRGLHQTEAFLEEQGLGQEEPLELRLFRVPALNFEALWLHDKSAPDDWFIPIVSLGSMEEGQPIILFEAWDHLRQQAEALGDMEDGMGA